MSRDVLLLIGAIATPVIGGVVAWLTTRTAAKAEVRKQGIASRTDIEREAFERARSFYVDVIDRQDRENAEQQAEIVQLRSEVGELKTATVRQENELARCKATCQALARRSGIPPGELDY